MKSTTSKKTPAKKKAASSRSKGVKKTPATRRRKTTAVKAVVAKRRYRSWLRFDFSFVLMVGVILIVAAIGVNYITANDQRNTVRLAEALTLSDQASETHLFYTKQVEPLAGDLNQFETEQSKAGLKVVDPTTITSRLHLIRVDLAKGKFHAASTATVDLRQNLTTWQSSLKKAEAVAAQQAAVSVAKAPSGPAPLNVPIIVYHKTPSDFEQQLLTLQSQGYTTITMAQLTAAWNGASLPAKPIILTFDDGFADQMDAFALLEKYQMKATFYIIDGGPLSDWCIGAGRRYNDPSQPAGGCGDAYLTWNQVRQLDQSGLITIGSHTIDHPDLPTETADQQRDEIAGGKSQLEAELGHPVYTFAYPYGDYNATTISIVGQAGFTTAVTTTGGTLQSAANRFTLDRIYTIP